MNLVAAYCLRSLPPQMPMRKYIGTRTTSKNTKNTMRSAARNVPIMPTSSSSTRATSAGSRAGLGGCERCRRGRGTPAAPTAPAAAARCRSAARWKRTPMLGSHETSTARLSWTPAASVLWYADVAGSGSCCRREDHVGRAVERRVGEPAEDAPRTVEPVDQQRADAGEGDSAGRHADRDARPRQHQPARRRPRARRAARRGRPAASSRDRHHDGDDDGAEHAGRSRRACTLPFWRAGDRRRPSGRCGRRR